jgi:hypothetical protein
MRARPLISVCLAAFGLLLALPASGMAGSPNGEPRFHVPSELRDVRYCEVLLRDPQGDQVLNRVYNTLGWNLCPPEQWDKLTVDEVIRETGAASAFLNGPRHWVLDSMKASGATLNGETRTFGGIRMTLRATVLTPAGAEIFYTPQRIKRDTIWQYDRGKPTFQLVDPKGNVYVMQAYGQIVDRTLTYRQLPTLGRRLQLPAGWRYRVRTPAYNLDLKASGEAIIVRDNLTNAYQRVVAPTPRITGLGGRCDNGTRTARIRVSGDTAMTRVTVGGRTLKRTTSDNFRVRIPAARGATVTVTSSNYAGVARRQAQVRACGAMALLASTPR